MKKSAFLFTCSLLLLLACSDDDNNTVRKADIEIIISATDNHRMSSVETIVYGTDLELRTNSSGNNHLPYKRTYIRQDVPPLTNINVSYRDNSAVSIGVSFVPYTVEISIEVDGEIVLLEEYDITLQGDGPSVDFPLDEYLKSR